MFTISWSCTENISLLEVIVLYISTPKHCQSVIGSFPNCAFENAPILVLLFKIVYFFSRDCSKKHKNEYLINLFYFNQKGAIVLNTSKKEVL